MPLIDVLCLTCGTFSEVNRPLAMWPATPPCPKCDQATEQRHLPPQVQSRCPAVVAYKMPDGSFRFPGRPDSPSTARYEAQGGVRVEARGWAEVRRFEGQVNAVERAKIERRVERQQRFTEEGTRARRSELYNQMKGMSDPAKALGRVMVRLNDAKPGLRVYDPGFRVEAFSESRSNREEARDERGRKLRD